MATQLLTRHPQTPNLHYWSGSFASSKVFLAQDGREVVQVQAMLQKGSAIAANDPAIFTWVPDATDKSEFTLYGWDSANGAGSTSSTINVIVTTK